MIERLPFYMVYQQEMIANAKKGSIPGSEYGSASNMMYETRSHDEERMVQRDYDYMKSAYPDVAKRIMPYVEEECDRLEYSGSMMYDEYPDQLQLLLLCRRIYRKVVDKEKWEGIRDGEDNLREKNGLYELVQVMTYHEILRRRSEYRKYRKNFY